MNSFESKWQELTSRGLSSTQWRLLPDHKLNFFISLSAAGKREVTIVIPGVSQAPAELPKFANIDIISLTKAGDLNLVLTLADELLQRSFSVMCLDIAERSEIGHDALVACDVVMKALRDWADLFKRKRDGGLSRSEAMGLWGELHVLGELLSAFAGGELELLNGWRGPHGDQRDIGLNGVRLEIKTQLATKTKSLGISSLDQLDDRGEHLFVALERVSSSVDGISLSTLISDLYSRLATNSAAQTAFERKIELSGYVEGSATSHDRLELDEQILFHVRADFPRLTPHNVDNGITAATYTISGARLDEFDVPWDLLQESMNG
ncbi:MAG: PD-(D/E)XK motif protein [Burkholderiales bacterium]|nr:PD-(D/E)XK motif protein [Burkholderiales bacterium]